MFCSFLYVYLFIVVLSLHSRIARTSHCLLVLVVIVCAVFIKHVVLVGGWGGGWGGGGGFFFFQAEDGIRDHCVTGVQTCALPI